MTTIIPAEVGHDRVQAAFLRAHLRLLRVGMKNSKLTRRQILEKVTAITAKKYRNSSDGVDDALEDIKEILK